MPADHDIATRLIVHADLDAFFASVEQRDDPALRGKPVLVGGTGPRGVVAAASYEARAFGCHSAMPTAVALRLCPHAIVVRPTGTRYRDASRAVFDILERFAPVIQPMGLDEAYLDMTGTQRALGPPERSLARLKQEVHAATALTISIGAGPNKFVAKIATDLGKPDGLMLIPAERVQALLWPMPVSKVPGVGEAAEKRLARLGIRTIGDLARTPPAALEPIFGAWGLELAARARGEDDRPVTPDRAAKSIGHERTFHHDIEDADHARAIVADHAEQVARRLRRHERLARTVTLKLRLGDYTTFTRAHTLDTPTDRTDAIATAGREILDAWIARSWRPLRLIGLTCSGLSEPGQEQLGLFDADTSQRQRAVDRAADAVAKRFGTDAIRRGSSLPPE